MKKRTVEIRLEDGLEATPIAMLVQKASQFGASIYLEASGKKVNAKSIMGMMSMAMDTGEKVIVSADGADEDAALDAIESYLAGK